MQLAWVALFAFLSLGLFIGPLNDACCLVGPSAPYKSIQAAIDAAPSGSTVVVFSGIYRENLVIDKPLKLLNADYTVLFPLLNHSAPAASARCRPPRHRRAGFERQGSGVYHTRRQRRHSDRRPSPGARVEQSNFPVPRRHPGAGRQRNLDQKQHAGQQHTQWGARPRQHARSGTGQKFERNDRGVRLARTQNSLIKANRFGQHAGYAITLSDATHNALAANRTLQPGLGVLLQDSAHTLMRDNHLAAGSDAFWIETQDLSGYEQDINTSNTIGGLPMLYLKGLKNRKLKPGLRPGFLALIDARGIEIANLRVDQMPVGILMVRAQDIRIVDAAIRNTRSGIVALQSQNILITDSTISQSQQNGLHFDNSNNIQVRRTMVFENGEHGLYAVGGGKLTVETSDITDNEGSALWLEGVSAGTLSDSDFSGNGQYGVSLQFADTLILRDNLMQDNQTGLHLNHANGNRVEDNRIQQNQFGIFLQASVDNTLTGNLLTLNARGGIKGDVDNNVLEDNIEDTPPLEEDQ